MKFFRTFIVCFLILGFATFVLAHILGPWSLFILPVFLIALAVHAYMELSDRLEKIEQMLGIATPPEEMPKPFTEQMKDDQDAENPAP